MKITQPNPMSRPSSGGIPGGAAGGDLGGTYPGPIVDGIGGIPIGDAPADNEILQYDLATNTIYWEALGAVGFLTVINGGGGTVQAHGNLGSTETINTANGNYHWGTLDANCTFTFTTTVDTAERWFTLELIENGTGGWTATWPGSVVWLGGATPVHPTTAGSTTIYAFFTRNGGTTWNGAQLASGGAFAAPAIVLGTAAAAGVASTVIRSDSTIVAFDTTVPASVGSANATGSAAKAARRDHVHAYDTTSPYREVVMVSGSVPPDPVLNSDGTDWVYGSPV